ncbi:MAG: MBOAT family protein [Micavibrio aeruginosavorus]|uniref:MBOAT family protein n=1 Tax=Micavibrio aeruginosavorus TaxID=349221 RepID=A0A7T5R2G0_9BACT|nr:MAG: MBOAT family protein [Micavibrio aeruginosavorus]
MLFNSLAYLSMLLLTRAVSLLTGRPALVFLASSIVFYLFAGWYDTFIFFGSVVVNWLICRYLPHNRLRLCAAILFNAGLLFFFKYAGFVTGTADNESSSYINAALPLGISFYTFQMLAYQIDVARGISKEASSFRSFALFISFFPQLIAGPIVRSRELLPQIERLFARRPRRLRLVAYGLSLFLLGLFKKVFIADSLSPFVDEIFNAGPESAVWAWLGGVLFSFQIYCDFSGYSDMAIGSAYLLGIRLPVNFRTPYLSQGPREFWQRWHITLSNWIRDYLYIPLGGSRGSVVKTGFVVIATMALAGLWHGADMTFVVWGGLWGAYIYATRYIPRGFLPIPGRILLHFSITVFLWVLFRSPDIHSALSYYKIMLGIEPGIPTQDSFHDERALLPALTAIAALLCCFHYLENRFSTLRTVRWLRHKDGIFLRSALITLTILIIMLPRVALNPFIYFRF